MEKSFYTSESIGWFVEQIQDSFDVLKFKKNQVLYSEESTPLGIYYLQEGGVLILKMASQGIEQVLRVTSEKGILCCADLLLNKRYSSSSRAITDSTVLFLPKAKFLIILEENHDIAFLIMKQMAKEVIFFQNEVTSLAYKPLRGMLADKLLSLNSDL